MSPIFLVAGTGKGYRIIPRILDKRTDETTYPDVFSVAGEAVDEKFAEWLWSDFYRTRTK